MFTGIVEHLGRVKGIERQKNNAVFNITCPFVEEIRIDQSISHDGVCLTVTEIRDSSYFVTAIEETLSRTNLGLLELGNFINLERCMPASGRYDGHIVQGHVDQIGTCVSIEDRGGSWIFRFEYDKSVGNFTVEKGSVCVNGVSLTVVDSADNSFTVAVIPYTFENTNFKFLKVGSVVNLEFDIVGKYLKKLFQLYK